MDKHLASAVTITRVFDAPREVVFRAFTDPDQLKRWWGPAHYTAPVIQTDLRPGGKYLYCMRSPEGQDVWSTGVYKEIDPPARLVCTDSFSDPQGNIVSGEAYGMGADFPAELLVTVIFDDLGRQTRVTLTHEGIPEGEMRDLTAAGWNESLDKMAASLKDAPGGAKNYTLTAQPGVQEITMTRVFDAPIELVARVWMDPALVPQWWGPAYLTTTVDKMDPIPGGQWRFVQTDPDGNQYGFHGVYHDVTTTRVVQTFEYEGVPGHVTLETIIFEPLEGNHTLVIDQSVFQSVADRDGMLGSGMESGAAELFDRMEKLLQERKRG